MAKQTVLDALLKEIQPMEMVATAYRMNVASQISDARMSKGWSVNELSEILGIRYKQLTFWLSGNYNFTLDDMVVLSEVLDIQFTINSKK